MKKIVLLLLLLTIQSYGQESIIIGKKDDVEISYQLTSISKGDKKDKYLIVVSAINKGSFDLYYEVPVFKDDKGMDSFGIVPDIGFSKITIRNTTGWFTDGVAVAGTQTTSKTEGGDVLFTLPKNKLMSFEFEFNTKAGIAPVITNTYIRGIQPLASFDVALNEAAVNGSWTSSCNKNNLNELKLSVDSTGKQYILQNVNGREFKWLKKSNTEFTKENDINSTLIYNKSSKAFAYQNSDGSSCTWTK